MQQKKFVIGNWKSNKTKSESVNFFNIFKKKLDSSKLSFRNIEIAVCPSFVHIESSRKLITDMRLPIGLGAQDISPFEMGAYTGEVNGHQLKEYVKYVIIGHSERRKHMMENNELLKLKVSQAKSCGLTIIFCVPDSNTEVPEGIHIIAYEPVFAIGTGKSDTPENANLVACLIKKNNHNIPVIYGGSVTDVNIKDFLKMDSIDGVLLGKASLDPETFYRMLINAAV